MKTENRNEQEAILQQENALKNESKYLSYFNTIMTKHLKEMFSNPIYHSKDIDHYSHEARILKQILLLQREAILIGTIITISTFASIRYLPLFLLKSIGSPDKIQKFNDMQTQRQKLPIVRRVTPIAMEACFSILIGYTGYKKAMEQQLDEEHDVFHTIAQCPLLQGRSLLSERMCQEWLDVAYYNHKKGATNSIPPIFWKNVHDKKVKNVTSWNTIEYFAHNCIKRQTYEDRWMLTHNLKERDGIVVPPPGVPEDILSDEEIKALTSFT